ncbi:MAG TPA: glycosyltransferase family 2 protein [Bryobacteraceae bacterium]|nr:glycosyltransferase family 2 protein [Bryobacteraceae bacterium]
MQVTAPLSTTVVLVNWNRREMLTECLRSLIRQTGVLFEVVVVDNGSSDGSVEMLEGVFVENLTFALHLIKNTDNKGFCAANNQGIAAARGEFIALLNNDAVAAEGWLSALEQALREYPQAGMAASKILVYENPTRIDKAGHLIYPDGQNRGRGSGETDCGQFDRMEEVLWPDGCAAMYRRSMLAEIGGFDEDLFAYGDDAELGLRARIAGWTCIYVPDAVVHHRRGATLGLLSSRRLELIERNRVLLVVKHFPLRMLFLSAPYYALRVAAGIWAALRGKGEVGRFPGVSGKVRVAMALLRGNWQALRMLPRTWRKRRQMDAIRRLTPAQVRELLLRYRISLRALMEQAI